MRSAPLADGYRGRVEEVVIFLRALENRLDLGIVVVELHLRLEIRDHGIRYACVRYLTWTNFAVFQRRGHSERDAEARNARCVGSAAGKDGICCHPGRNGDGNGFHILR